MGGTTINPSSLDWGMMGFSLLDVLARKERANAGFT
jgi:hypothetical protein